MHTECLSTQRLSSHYAKQCHCRNYTVLCKYVVLYCTKIWTSAIAVVMLQSCWLCSELLAVLQSCGWLSELMVMLQSSAVLQSCGHAYQQN